MLDDVNGAGEIDARREGVGRGRAADDDQEFIQSLAKGLAVIEAFSETSPQMTLSEVSRRVGLSPGSARRVLRTLHQLGYASCQGTRFELTPRVLQLGYSYLTSLPVASLVRPRLTALTEEVNANSAISVLDGADIVFVARVTAKYTVRECVVVGTRFPVHTTSAGKVLLADMDLPELEALFAGRELEPLTAKSITSVAELHEVVKQVRVDGWAISDQEALIGHRSITAPVRVNGRTVAAVGVGAHVGVASLNQMLESYLPPLRAAAEDISQILRSHPSAEPRTGRATTSRRARATPPAA
jgi:IclR family pca regulon transcriptional regulator